MMDYRSWAYHTISFLGTRLEAISAVPYKPLHKFYKIYSVRAMVVDYPFVALLSHEPSSNVDKAHFPHGCSHAAKPLLGRGWVAR